MTGMSNGECQNIISQVQAYITKNANPKDTNLLSAFAQRYFANCSIEDLRSRSIADLYGILYSHWQFINKRAPGEAKIRIFNPDTAKDGWHSTHTVIQISHDDIPFLVDSVRMVINHYGYQLHFIVHFGGFKVQRNAQHHITDMVTTPTDDAATFSEAPIYIEIDRLSDEKEMTELHADIERVLADVRAAVADWHQMVERVKDALFELEQNPPKLEEAEIAESCDFLRWLINNNFTFLGSRDYKLIGNDTNRALQIIPGSGLGVLRDESTSATAKSYTELPPASS